MSKYPGRVLSATPPSVSTAGASGVWTQEEVAKYNAEGVWPQQPLPYDPYFQNTVLLLHGDGNQGATNFSNISDPVYLAFKDNSSNNFPITVNGDAYGDNFGPYALEDGYWGTYYDGTGDYLNVGTMTALGSGDFTISCWVYPQLLGRGVFHVGGLPSSVTGIAVSMALTSEGWNLYAKNTQTVSNTGVIALNRWYYLTVVRSGTTTTLYVDGVSTIVVSSDSTNYTQTSLAIGGFYSTSYLLTGYIADFRIVVGTALAPSGVPTSPSTAVSGTSLLTCQSNRFVDNSANNFTITPAGNVAVKVFNPFGELPDGVNGSGYFDGSGDFIGYPTDTALTFGTGDYTVECWVYFTAINSTDLQILFSSGSTGDSFFFHADGNQLSVGTSSVFVSSQSATFVTGTWYHVAACRSGGTLRLFQNGVQVGSSVSDSTNWVSSGTPRIGANGIGTQTVFGYISNSRVVKGTALYNSAFTPPTAPLTNITNTSLLTCQYAGTVRNVGFIDSGPYDFPITRVGNTTQGSFSPFSKPDGRWGNYFDGSSSTLQVPSNTAFNVGTGDFTLEFWINRINNTFGVFKLYSSSTSNGPQVDGSNYASWHKDGVGSILTSTTALSVGEFYHIAYCRSGTTFRLFVNGVQEASVTNSDSFDFSSWIIGRGYYGNVFNGYLSNFRLLKAVALYTSGFTPSTSPLTAISGTSLLTCQSNRFVDNSANNFALTPYVSAPKVTPFSPFPLTTEYSPSVNGGSAYFDANNGYLTIPYSSSVEFGSRDWTVEMWIYVDSTHWASSPAPIINYKSDTNSHYGASFGTNNPGYASLALSTTGSSWAVVATSTDRMYGDTWNHVAFVRSGANIYIYTNGKRYTASTTYSGNVYVVPNVPVIIGRGGTGGNYQYQFKGSMSGLRVTHGTALYTDATVAVPTTPPTSISGTNILCNYTNAGVYDSTAFNNLQTVGNAQIDTTTKKYGTGAMEFDGTGDALTIPSSIDFTFGTGNFTIEFWVNISSFASNRVLFDIANGTVLQIYTDTSGSLRFYTPSADRITSTSNLSTSTWYHIAVTRSGTSTKMFVDGVQTGSTYTDSNNYAAGGVGIGGRFDSTISLLGYIDDLRITKGVARYTTNFDPPTIPFRNIGA